MFETIQDEQKGKEKEVAKYLSGKKENYLYGRKIT